MSRRKYAIFGCEIRLMMGVPQPNGIIPAWPRMPITSWVRAYRSRISSLSKSYIGMTGNEMPCSRRRSKAIFSSSSECAAHFTSASSPKSRTACAIWDRK